LESTQPAKPEAAGAAPNGDACAVAGEVHIATPTAINAEQIRKAATGLASSGNPRNRLKAISTVFMDIAP
jgi:hypothetical protein